MKNIFLLTAILTMALSRQLLHAQTNLICNHSFENVNAPLFNKLNDGSFLVSSHLDITLGSTTLFDCWYADSYNAPWGTAWRRKDLPFSAGLLGISGDDLHQQR